MLAKVDELIGGTCKSFSTVEGILQAVDLSRKPLFRIYDLLTNKSLRCYFPSDFLEKIQDALGKRVSVYGVIRSREDGEKVSIEVQEMEIFPSEEELPSIEDIVGILGGED